MSGPTTISYTGASTTFTVPATGAGDYYIVAYGAQGGTGIGKSGGLGAARSAGNSPLLLARC
jgi:hypothetical protein